MIFSASHFPLASNALRMHICTVHLLASVLPYHVGCQEGFHQWLHTPEMPDPMCKFCPLNRNPLKSCMMELMPCE